MAVQPSAVTTATLSISQCVTLKLNDTNYLSWKLQFEQFLNSQLLLGYVTGALARPPPTVVVRNGEQVTETNNPEFLKWMQTDQLIMAWIFGSLSEDTLKSVYGLRSSQEVWFYLAKKYNRVSATRKLDIQRKIQTTTKGTRSLAQYLSEIKALCDQLDSIGAPISEQEKIYGVLSGVGREYESIVTVIEESMDLPTSPSFEDVLYKLTNFDDKLQKYETPPEVNPHQAFYTAMEENSHKAFYTARGGYSGRGRGQNRGGSRGRSSYTTQGRGFPQQFGQGSNKNSYGANDQRPTCQICGKYGHAAYKCYKRFDENYQTEVETFPQAMAAMKLNDSPQYPGGGWYPDSAATHHITNTPANLNTSQPYEGSEHVIVGNGDFLPITHVGSIALPGISGTLPLKDVLVCPEIAKSLLSVSKLTDDYPCKFEFDSDSVCVKDKVTNKLLSQGSKLNGLYKLDNPQFLAYYSSRQQSTSDVIWHRRLGHPHHQVMQHLSTISAISYNKTTKSMCEACQLGKTCRLPFSRSEFQASKPLERIHCDVWGPAPVTSVQGFRFYIVFIDNYSRFCWFYPLKLKSEVFLVFKSFQSLVENQFNQKIKIFQSDGGGEFVNKQMQSHFELCGIQHFISCPHTPQQNGLAERKHRHILELGMSMLYHSQLPQQLWVDALFTANFLSNLLPTTIHDKLQSPYEVLNGISPVYTALRVFGCACYPYLRPYTENKFDPKSLLCVFLGYTEKYKGYRCLHPPTGRVYISRHVLFDETRFPYSETYRYLLSPGKTPLLQAWYSGNKEPASTTAPEDSVEELSVQASQHEPERTAVTSESVLPQVSESPTNSPQHSPVNSPQQSNSSTSDSQHSENVQEEPVGNTHGMVTRAKQGIHKPNPRYVMHTVKGLPEEPKTVKEALNHPGWTAAMGEEIDTCHVTKTWSLVPKPAEINLLGCRWIFKTKINADGTLDKLRARLVAKGYEQEEGVDFLETYSPVVRTATVRMVLHTAVSERWDIKQLDVKNAFLHGDLQETVYMRQPPGFEDPEKPDHVCLLHKAIYGLKQAPRAWFDKFSSYLVDFGFICSTGDPSLFIYQEQQSVMLLLMYVDDMVLTGNDSSLISKLLSKLNEKFMMKDMGPLKYFLGIQAQFTPKGLFLNQEKYATDLLINAGMLDCAPMPTPLPVQIDRMPHQDELFQEPTYFRSLAGKLQYLTLTRPDIQFAVNFICQKMHSPSVSDFNLLKRILRYLKGTLTMGVSFSSETDSVLRAYCDSDHAGCKETRRSTGGFCTFLGSNIISWSAKRQESVARSSTEAEYRTLSDTAAEMSWITAVLKQIGLPQEKTPEVYCDNLAAVFLSANPVLHTRSKHFATHFHFAREMVAMGTLIVKHIPAHLQIADIFTKPLPQGSFLSLRFKLGVDYPPTSSLRGDVKASSSVQNREAHQEPKLQSKATPTELVEGAYPSAVVWFWSSMWSLLKFNRGGVSRSWIPVEDAVVCFEDPHGSTVVLVAVAMAEVGGDKVAVWMSHHPLDPPRCVFTGPVVVPSAWSNRRNWRGKEGDKSMGWVARSGPDSVEPVVAAASFPGDLWRIWRVDGKRSRLGIEPFRLLFSIYRRCCEVGYLGFTGSNAPATVQSSISRVRSFKSVSGNFLIRLFCNWIIVCKAFTKSIWED
ncbi:Reverse transcriptase RNA-dependent DNA polymerase [Arabidopsis thaliana x Arabidopsis arenosa]|uniref:Reverse transcriptase RNA-dependent DNA polymerase n=1 Tax=Arabidopsis thaliana x Arabidopsis arenosa TaxID=1240361 RepID=A0A8T2CDX1_9BRAS|nr:Reverse transcriptase RNA-dependent DNA polymerase [Arabidopsis thaliana x Arabidopsis arenosa]